MSDMTIDKTEITETDAEWEARGLAEGWQAQGDEGGIDHVHSALPEPEVRRGQNHD